MEAIFNPDHPGEKDYYHVRGFLVDWMERKPGFKECPRCGLRNKPSVAQCDFCGWEFQGATDEWSSHVRVLETLNRETDSIVLDDELSKKIESTIVHTSREVMAAQRTEPRGLANADSPVNEEELQSAGKKWTADHMTPVDMPSAEMREVKAFVDTMIGQPVSEPPAPSPMAEKQVVEAPVSPIGELRSELPVAKVSRFGKSVRLPAGIMAAGVVVYLIALGLYSITALDTPVGWGLAIAGAFTITLGAGFAYEAREIERRPIEPVIGTVESAPNEVVICPKCNELVSERADSCPNCGARFHDMD